MMTDVAETTRESGAVEIRLPWYRREVKWLSWKRLLYLLLIALVVVSVSVVPFWRLCWYYPIYSTGNFASIRDAHGRKQPAWHWVKGKEIRIYQPPTHRLWQAEIIAGGVRELLSDAGLDFTVRVLPMPPAVLAAYQASLVRQSVNGIEQSCISFDTLQAHLVELRAGDPHADMLIVNVPIADCWWAQGMAAFNSGLSLVEEDFVSHHLGKHESVHLLGYQAHDSFPLHVIGYRWEGFPWKRDTLMMLHGQSNTLSPRAFDALHYFWRGMEKRLGMQFLK